MFRCSTCSAAQDDILLPTTTPREALQFAAALRLPTPNYTKQQQQAAVARLIDGMKLEHCADTLVGGALVFGIRKYQNIIIIYYIYNSIINI
jgi:ABC-type multidrug transport system ATPase subunit